MTFRKAKKEIMKFIHSNPETRGMLNINKNYKGFESELWERKKKKYWRRTNG